MSQVAKSVSALERAFLAMLVLELEAMVVRPIGHFKFAGVHGDRLTARLGISGMSGVPLGACGFALAATQKHRHQPERVHIQSAADGDEINDAEPAFATPGAWSAAN